jgi:F0F1-type ATP synthase assembly protein I
MSKEQDKKTETFNIFSALSLAFELGYIVAIPIVGFALGGRLLDRRFDSAPIFLLLGIFVSILLSSYLVYKKTQKIIQET